MHLGSDLSLFSPLSGDYRRHQNRKNKLQLEVAARSCSGMLRRKVAKECCEGKLQVVKESFDHNTEFHYLDSLD